MRAVTKKKPARSAKPGTSRRQAIIIVVPGGKISKAELNKIARTPVELDEDEADYQYSMAVLREGGRLVSAESVLKKYGRRVDR